MKKIAFICLAATLTISSVSALPPVNEKVLTVFKTSFPEIRKTTWNENKDFYSVIFVDTDGSKCSIDYDPEGNILSSTRYYSEENLSPFIRGKVKEKFPGKKIFGITEYSSGDEFTYHLSLQDENNWYNVKCDATGHARLEKKLTKAESK